MKSLTRNETGAALITAILVLMLASGLTLGMFAALTSNSRSQASDRDQSVAYAAAHAGLEKLTASLAQLFMTDFSPSAAQITVVDSTPPSIPGFTYTSPGGSSGSGYDITFTPDPGPGANTGNPLPEANLDITTGPFEGFKGLITPYTLTVTARSTTGQSEVRLRRELQTVAVPVFQFGIFGEKSLGFHAGPQFDFGGRVHTNESLFLANGDGQSLIFRDKITAVLQVVRNKLSNGRDTADTNHEGSVMIPKVIGGAYPGSYRDLLKAESSGRVTTPCIALATTDSRCYTNWQTLSSNTYAANIRTEATGARRLNLPLTSANATPIDLIRRPPPTEAINGPVFGQRYFAQASLRILLSDRASDITGLPSIVTSTSPIALTNAGVTAGGYTVAAHMPPLPTSIGNEPVFTLLPPSGYALGQSITRLGSTPTGTTLDIEYHNGVSWVAGVPEWMKVIPKIGSTTVPCYTLRLTQDQLRNCSSHGSLASGTVVNFVRPDGSTAFSATMNNASTGSNDIRFPTTGTGSLATARRFPATTMFFVGEDPVVCTGYAGTTTAGTTQLTGCTWPSGASLVDNDPIYTGATTTANTELLGGFIKIEKQNASGVWSDVTMEILNLGFSAPNQEGDICDDPTPNAVIRMYRLRDNGLASGGCSATATDYHESLTSTDYWPLQLYDAREGNSRLQDVDAGMNMGGLISYVALDVANFKRWVAGTIGSTGNQAYNNNGYIIYFSDRRGDHNEGASNDETGEYGHEDSINPATEAWAKSNALETGEDFNENATLQTYGESPHTLAMPGTEVANMGFTAAQRPWFCLTTSPANGTCNTGSDRQYSGRARAARTILFRRALKVINGGIDGSSVNSIPDSGIAITTENPIYLQGNFNATAASVTAEPNRPAALMADAITLLSSAWTDTGTFIYPNDQTNRNATTTGYRFAMVTGKAIPFPKPTAWGVQELGSDGGVHNFMRMLEDWGSQTLRYRGSMVSLYYSRQAIGIYRADANIYGAPTRGYNFDTDFLSPPLLPPGTPMFRDINTLKFRQILRPNQ